MPDPGVASWTEFYISNVSSCVEECGKPGQPGQNYLGWEGGRGRRDYFQHSSPVQSPALPALPLTPSQNVPTNTKLGQLFTNKKGEIVSQPPDLFKVLIVRCCEREESQRQVVRGGRWGLCLSRDRTSLQWSSQTPPPSPRTIKRMAEEQSLSLSHKQSLGEVVSEQTKENVSTTPYWNLLESVRIVLT